MNRDQLERLRRLEGEMLVVKRQVMTLAGTLDQLHRDVIDILQAELAGPLIR